MNSPGKFKQIHSAGQAQRVAELGKLLNKHSKPRDQIRDKLKITSFSSGKGGTGKSFLSLNTAIALSKNKKLLFIDLDLNLSNIHLMLNIIPEKTISAYFEGKNILPEVISKSGSIDFIFGESGSLKPPEITESVIENFFKDLQKIESEYDFIILDTGSGIGDNVMSFLRCSDINIIVATPEPTSVMDAYVILKILKSNGYGGYISLVINKCSDPEEGKKAFINLNSASIKFLNEKIKLLGLVEYNREVTQTISEQIPFVNKYSTGIKDHVFLRSLSQINKLAAGLVEIQQMANIHQP